MILNCFQTFAINLLSKLRRYIMGMGEDGGDGDGGDGGGIEYEDGLVGFSRLTPGFHS